MNHLLARSIGALALLAAVVATVLVVPVVPAAAAPHQTTITNFDAAGQQVTRYDTEGNAVDAHDGDLAFFDGVYYLYGTSYDCGYQLQISGTPFCGFKSYSSTDLVHWTDRGLLFNASTALWQSRCAPPRFGCYRPHVVYNSATNRYVLWINGYDNNSGYHVFTSTTPVGPFTEVAEPRLAVQGSGPGFNNGDMDLFVDNDGTGYLAYTDIRGGHRQVVEQLNASYTSGTGQHTVVGGQGTEAPSLFRRGNTYYHVSGNTCPYCAARTEFRTASNPLTTWSGPRTINSNSCNGQPAFVATIPTLSGTAYLYGADLWHAGKANQALANYFWTPLTFARNGAVEPFSCTASATLDLATGAPGSQHPIPDLDRHSGVTGFRTHCDIASGWSRLQSFVPSRTGRLDAASLTVFQEGASHDLVIDLVTVDDGLRPTGTLSTTVVPRTAVGWSPRQIVVRTRGSVSAGVRYALLARSAATTGCYGFAYNDAAPYPGGGSSYRSGTGNWTPEVNRSHKFMTAVTTSSAYATAVSASSSYTGGGWRLDAINDGLITSTSASMGWSSNDQLQTDHTESLQFDLGDSKPVSSVMLFPRADPGNQGQGFPVDVRIDVSPNGTTWTAVAQVADLPTPTSGTPLRLGFSPVQARYVRLVGTRLRNTNPNDPTYRLQFAEVGIY
ncbi:discoidin domain-containing protein [Nonomuraea sp. SYSU D8015]|uniref:discoidin domain-containing protein n=1 Tax=Nonomuraea sp. SYSU D8015 TaxID=2593644 RepID=UPI0016607D49|nr:discoidin domain-containing protein [Nonomuraea sp. SYSU D8015]